LRAVGAAATSLAPFIVGLVLILASIAKTKQPTHTFESLSWALPTHLAHASVMVLVVVEATPGACLHS
jgi:hypothetical protein